MADNFTVGVRLYADGSDLRGEMRLSGAELEKLKGNIGQVNQELDEHGRKTATVKQGYDDMVRGGTLVHQTMRNMAAAAGTFIAAMGVREIAEIVDQWTALSARVRVATADTGDFTTVWQQLRDAAFETRTSLESNVDLFQRLTINREALGATNQELLQVVETVNLLGKASGATQADMDNATRQLGQALGQTYLRAEEFNSIIEQMPALVQEIADAMGLTTAEFGNAVREGEVLSTNVLDAIIAKAPEVAEKFSDIPLTIGDAMGQLGLSLTEVLGKFDEASGASSAFARAISAIAEALRPDGPAERIADINEELDRLGKQGRLASDRAISLRTELRALNEELKKTADEGAKAGDGLARTGTSVKDLTEEYQKLRDQLFPLEQETREYNETLEEVNDLYERGIIKNEIELQEVREALYRTTSDYAAELKEVERQEKLVAAAKKENEAIVKRQDALQKQVTAEVARYRREWEQTQSQITDDFIAQAWENAADRIDETFFKVFRDGFEDINGLIDGIGVALRDLAAEAAYGLFKEAIFGGGQTSQFLSGLLPTGTELTAARQFGIGAALAGGSIGGGMLGGGGTGAQIGGAGGSIGGLFLASALGAGPVGLAAGALLGGAGGGLLGGLFDEGNAPPRIAVEGGPAGFLGVRQGSVGQRSAVATGAFGSVRVGGEDGQGRTPEMQQLANTMVAFDNLIAARLDPSSVGVAANRANAAVLQSTRASNFDPRMTVFDRVMAAMTAAGNDLERIWERIEDVDVTNFEGALDSTLILYDFINEDLGQSFTDITDTIANSSDSLYESSLKSGQALLDMAANFDGTAASADELAQATLNRQAAEAAMLAQIDQIRNSVERQSENLRERIRRDLETDQQTLNRLVTQSQQDIASLSTLTDPSDISRVANRAFSNLGDAWSLMSPEQRAAREQEFSSMLDTIEEATEGQLDAATQMIQEQGQAIRDAVSEALVEPSANLQSAASSMQQATVILRQAAANLPDSITVSTSVDGF